MISIHIRNYIISSMGSIKRTLRALLIIGGLWGPTGCSKNWNRNNKQDTILAKDISKTPLDTLIDQVENEDLKQSLLNLRKNPSKLNDSVNSNGDTGLILAARQQNNQVLEHLINLGADPNVANEMAKQPCTRQALILKLYKRS